LKEEFGMAESSGKTAQIHVRVPPEFKKALKIFCVREGTTEQADLSFESALTFGDWDINENWLKYKEEFLKGVQHE
jgi:hypothetical protein